MSTQKVMEKETLVFTVDTEHIFAIDSKYVLELIHRTVQNIIRVPKTKYPFLGVTLYNSRAIPIIDFKGWSLPNIETTEIDNRLGIVVIDYEGITMGFVISEVLGYENISETTTEVSDISLNKEFIDDNFYRLSEDENHIIYFNLQHTIGHFIGEQLAKTEEDDDIDIDQFTISEEDDDIDIDQFTIDE